MVGTKDFTIGETEYRITQLGALEGRKLWLRVVKTLVAIVTVLATAKSLTEESMAAAVGTLVAELDEETYEIMLKAFAKRCLIRNGDKWPAMDETHFDQHFAGNYVEMSKWLGECLMFNFANFSGDASLGNLIAGFKAKAAAAVNASKSKSPTISTGTSGA